MLMCSPRGGARTGSGRPPKPSEEKYSSHHIKFLDDDWEKVKRKAKEKGISASEYVRRKALED